jgi:hypothetical protein
MLISYFDFFDFINSTTPEPLGSMHLEPPDTLMPVFKSGFIINAQSAPDLQQASPEEGRHLRHAEPIMNVPDGRSAMSSTYVRRGCQSELAFINAPRAPMYIDDSCQEKQSASMN